MCAIVRGGVMSSKDSLRREDDPNILIREICAKWGEVKSFVGRYHLDQALANHSRNISDENAMSYLRKIFKRRQKQISLEKSLVRQRPSESQAESRGAKSQKKEREETSEKQVT